MNKFAIKNNNRKYFLKYIFNISLYIQLMIKYFKVQKTYFKLVAKTYTIFFFFFINNKISIMYTCGQVC